jgi:four helix bundle protein
MTQMTNNKKYDLEERTFLFGKNIIDLSKKLPNNNSNAVLIKQFIRSGTSVGANYREANETCTKKDFKFKIGICLRESKETAYWLKLLLHSNPTLSKEISPLLQENQELVKIFGAISNKT